MENECPTSLVRHGIENAAFVRLASILEALFLTALPSPSSLTTCVAQFELRLSPRQAPSSWPLTIPSLPLGSNTLPSHFFLFLDLILGSVTFVKAKDGKRGWEPMKNGAAFQSVCKHLQHFTSSSSVFTLREVCSSCVCWTAWRTQVGEDGPTHQPIETIPSLRLIPDLTVMRPADGNETAGAYKYLVKYK